MLPILGGIDLGVIYILVYGEASAGLQNIDRLLGLVGCVTNFGGIDLGVIYILVYGEASAGLHS